MLGTENGEAGSAGLPSHIKLVPTMSSEVMLEHMRSAHGRGLPDVKPCKVHDNILSVAAGGPSLEDTYTELEGYIAAVNGSQAFLRGKGVLPDACAVLDPNAHMTDIIEADKRVRYFIASTCHPSVFDKLEKAGCFVYLWHPTGTPGSELVCWAERPKDWLMIGGGTTMGLRWINLGYMLGFRRFHLHGMDSSFRDGQTHAYPDRRDHDDKGASTLDGYKTRLNFVIQVVDFFELLARFLKDDIEPIGIEVFGDGLLQSRWKKYREDHPDSYKL